MNDAAARARKYIEALTSAYDKAKPKTVDSGVSVAGIRKVTDAIQRYLQDAQHYLNQDQGTTALASVAYAEGLLDALTYLGLA